MTGGSSPPLAARLWDWAGAGAAGIIREADDSVVGRRERGVALVLLAVGALAAGCGGGAAGTVTYLAAGQVPRADLPHLGADRQVISSADTIPLAKENTTTALFASIGEFQSCLKVKGVTFIGAPTQGDPSSPTNNPSYVKALATCAAESKILQALTAEQTAQEDLTPAQVKKENQLYLKWRTCMIARGWGIPEPKPNTKGLLFSFGASSGVPQFKPPPGQSLLSSSDLQDCAAKAEEEGSS